VTRRKIEKKSEIKLRESMKLEETKNGIKRKNSFVVTNFKNK
jgi:hypothetical protein